MADSDYNPSTATEVWGNHMAAAAAADIDRVMLDYTDDSVVLKTDMTTDTTTEYRGRAAIRTFFESWFEAFYDPSTMAMPHSAVEDDPGHVFLTWRCPSSGFLHGSDSVAFTATCPVKISRQDVTFVSAPKK